MSRILESWQFLFEYCEHCVRAKYKCEHYHTINLRLTSDPQVARLMREAGKEHLLSRLAYPDTGHLIEPPFSPHFRATTFVMRSSKEKGQIPTPVQRLCSHFLFLT